MFKKTLTLMFLTMFEKKKSCLQSIFTMLFITFLKKERFHTFFFKYKNILRLTNKQKMACKTYTGLCFWLNKLTFVIALHGVHKAKNIVLFA